MPFLGDNLMGSSAMPGTDRRHEVGVEIFRLAVIIGGVREGRYGSVVADWFIGQVERRDELDIDVIDLAEVDLPFGLDGPAEHEPHDPARHDPARQDPGPRDLGPRDLGPHGLAQHDPAENYLVQNDLAQTASSAFTVRRRLDAADAYVVVTPECHHASAVRRLVDRHGRPWQAKPVGFVSYGRTDAGGFAVERLRPLFAGVHAVPVREQVTLPYAWELFDEDGSSRQPAECEEAAQAMLDQLAWWAVTLRRGRERRPYAA
ncbi:NADPH-dependent FMN reductase [Yinghuangia sp. YIM S09857]|uniref:NADPH-dependent FMN reductase n=1 Tax=Yinghuangia sp. YIM S09857 TaxID=3436929 RepID=UPI003F538417